MDQLEMLNQALKAKGYRATAARLAILQSLIACGGHVSADELAEKVRQQNPTVGRMTVYRTLDVLSQMGLIRPVYQGTGAAHYILLADGHHHHLICSHCSQVIEFEECVLGEVAEMIRDRFHFQIHGHLLEFYGLCQACGDKN